MSLSTEQELSLYEILQVPYNTTINQLQPEYNLTSIEITSDSPEFTAHLKIQNKLTEIAGIPALETKLKGYLDDWIGLGTNVTDLNGGFEGINGIDDSPDRERMVIASRVKIIVPFYRHHEELAGTMARNLSACIMR